MYGRVGASTAISLCLILLPGLAHGTVSAVLTCALPATLLLDLPHVPDAAPTRITVAGRTVAACAYASIARDPLPVAEHIPDAAGTISVRITDPQVRDRYLYAATVTCAPPDSGGVRPRPRMTIGLDGVAVGPEDATVEWDPVARPVAHLHDAPLGDGVAASLALDAGIDQVSAGTRRLSAALEIANRGTAPIRVLDTALMGSYDGNDAPAALSAFATSPRPRLIMPGEIGRQTFRIDTFDDTPAGAVEIVPTVAYVDARDDLLGEGDRGEDPAAGSIWQGITATGAAAAPTPEPASADAVSAFADRIADWREYGEAVFSPPIGVGLSGSAYAAFALPEALESTGPIFTTMPLALPEGGGRALTLGCASWGGEGVRLELLDAAGLPVAATQRNFSGFWWRDAVANWIERTVGLPAPPDAVSARVSLLGRSKATWWDNLYLVPADAVRRAQPHSATVAVAPPATTDRAIVYLGEDRDTQGDWIGNYGSYCWALSAMSAPRDMVGGQVEPLKCKHFDFGQTYHNEVIRVGGEGEFRYTGWTTNPKDPLTRHWIGAMRSDERRALENPQWGERTYASWDDHGELHPTDWWGPDLLVRLRVPEGLWKVSFYFLDWDWHAAPFPRDHRLELGALEGPPECFARVTDAGDGVYKAFAVQGGRDLLVRIRKDQSAAVLTSGIFLDPLAAPPLHPLGARIPEDLRDALKRLDGADALDLSVQVTAAALARRVEQFAAAGPDALLDPATQRLRVELWRRTVGHLPEQRAAFDAYAAALRQLPEPERVAEHLRREAEEYFQAGDLGSAELRYDAAHEVMRGYAEGRELADAHRDVALQFRLEHPLYAQRQIDRCLAALADRPVEEQVAHARALAEELFGVATADYQEGRGLVRLPYALAEFAYGRLIELVGYDGLTRDERMKLMLCLERQTWYTLGWERLAAEQERLIESLPEADVTGELLTHLIRSYAVLAQTDGAYIDRAAQIAERLKTELPDGDWTLDAYFRMAQIYYHERRWEQAKEACTKVLELAPGTPEAGSAERMLKAMQEGG